MLVEGFVALMALIAACTLLPGDYFAINTPVGDYAGFLARHPELKAVDLQHFSDRIGVDLHGRTGAPCPWPSGWPIFLIRCLLWTM